MVQPWAVTFLWSVSGQKAGEKRNAKMAHKEGHCFRFGKIVRENQRKNEMMSTSIGIMFSCRNF